MMSVWDCLVKTANQSSEKELIDEVMEGDFSTQSRDDHLIRKSIYRRETLELRKFA